MGFCPFSEIRKLYPRKENHVNPMIDLVADLGEGFGAYIIGDDSELLEIVSSANIACGFHAGDPDIMAATVAECVRRGVGIGAHPSFPDLRGFGRRDMGLSAHEVQNDVLYQLGALSGFAAFNGTKVTHIAPHGRLGNLVAVRADYASAVAEAAAQVDNELIVVAQEGELASAARSAGLDVAIVGIVVEGKLRCASGVDMDINVDTVLLHGDNPGAVELARLIRSELVAAGVQIAPLAEVMDAKRKAA